MLDDTILNQISLYKQSEKDEYFLKDLETIEQANDEQELYERFYTDLEFGTGGIRGIIGAGTNRLNTLIVQRVATGWAKYLISAFPNTTPKVVIAYDSRNFSDVFSKVVSEVLLAYNIKVCCYKSLRSTPQLSFTIRHLNAHSGLVITASHNPPKYNGLKIYWNDGAQVVAPHDKNIMDEIAKTKTETNILHRSLQDAQKEGLYEEVGTYLDKQFKNYIHSVLLQPEIFEVEDDFKVVYTPLHGTGAQSVEPLMQDYHIKGVVEPSQKEPDGSFPTVKYPNPEEPEALANAISTAKSIGASLVVANDPDADRVGIAQLYNGEFVCLNGNETGVLLFDYIMQIRNANGKSNDNCGFVNTIVTTTLQDKIAQKYGLQVKKCYTGFKNIAEEMKKFDIDNVEYVFGCEESYGYLASAEVRDKDGISIALLCMEMAKHYYSQNKTLFDRLDEIHKEFGYHHEKALNKVLDGASGKEKIALIMTRLRENTPPTLGDEQIVQVDDYLLQKTTDVEGNEIESLSFSSTSNVLVFTTNSGNKLAIRPSGTEPKIKFYLMFQASPEESVELASVKQTTNQKVDKAILTIEEWLV